MNTEDILDRLSETLKTRLPQNGGDPSSSYVAKLLHKGPDAFLKKIGEEAAEVIMACKDGERDKIIYEVADLWFHSIVALAYYNVDSRDIASELARREGVSGLQEKASRTSLTDKQE